MTRWLHDWWCAHWHRKNPGHKNIEDRTIDHVRVLKFWCRRCHRTWTREEYLPVEPSVRPWMSFSRKYDHAPEA